ncbi:MAG: hypothetical protein K8T26_05320 [Lentisphaerae bacterium]|nr:hypothetical protein [Lentisphaerota bacterium]
MSIDLTPTLRFALPALFVAALALPPALGQTPAAPAPATLDPQIAMLQQHVALQEEKVRALTADMIAIDQGVEREVTRMVDDLAALSDSDDSDTKIATQKRETIAALKRCIDFYRKLREERKAQLLHPTYLNVSDEDLKQDMARLDERTEARVEQILQVTESLAQAPEIARADRYETAENGRRLGLTDAYRQSERLHQNSETTVNKVSEGLEKDKARLTAENARLNQQLSMTRDPDTVEFLKSSIAWNEELIVRRTEQAAAVTSGTATTSPAGSDYAGNAKDPQPVTRKAANELDREFDAARLDIKAQYQKLLTLKTRRDQERAQLKRLNDKLASATAAQASAP